MLHMSFPVRTPLLLILLAGLLATVPADAAKPGGADRKRDGAEEAPAVPRAVMSKDAAVALVRERSGGKVVRADRNEQGGRVVYRIRVLTADGRVREYRVDATTGAMH